MRIIIGLVVLLSVTSTLFGFEVVPGMTKGTQGTIMQNAESDHVVPYYPASRDTLVLFVEDPGDAGFGPVTRPDPNWQAELTTALGADHFGWYGATATQTEDGPDLATMQPYELVIWNCYDNWFSGPGALTDNDTTNIGAYIAGGGHFWLIGPDILYGAGSTIYPWMQTNFHMASVVEDYTNAPIINLQGQGEIDGLSLEVTSDYQFNPFYCDALTPDGEAHDIMLDLDLVQFNCIASPNTLPLETSFWTVDGRMPNPGATWTQIVHDMLAAFGALEGINEGNVNPSKSLSFRVPSISKGNANLEINLPEAANVKLVVYNVDGRLCQTIISGQLAVGNHKVVANLNDLPAGVYFFNLKVNSSVWTEKSLLVR